MDVLRAVPVAVVVLAAACSGGHSTRRSPFPPKPRGVYEARIVTRLRHPGSLLAAPGLELAFIDTSSGAFRLRTTAGTRGPHVRFVTTAVSAGRGSGTRTITSAGVTRAIAFRGSPRFLRSQLGGTTLAVLRAYLLGTPVPSGVTVHVERPGRVEARSAADVWTITVARMRVAPPGTFRTITRRAGGRVTEILPGTRPASPVPAYWLGPSFNGHGALTSSFSTGIAGAGYAVSYPHLSIEVDRGFAGLGGRRPVVLGDGTLASMMVARPAPDGSYSLEQSQPGEAQGEVVFEASSTLGPGATIALVFLPHAMITLSGTAVTPATAAAIARGLRPL